MTQTHTQGNTAAAQLGALNMNPADRNLAPQQLTAAQQQQLLLQQGLNPSQLNSPQFQQLLRAGLIGGQAGVANLQSAVNMAALMRPQAAQQSRQGSAQNKSFPGKLTQIKEFPIEKSNQQPYKLQKALIDQKIVPCINVRPYVFHDLMMSLPDFVKHFFPDLPLGEESGDAPRNPQGCPVQGEHRPPGGPQNRRQVRGVRPCAPGSCQGHHDLHAPDEIHVQQHDGGNRACGEETEGCLDFQTTTMKKRTGLLRRRRDREIVRRGGEGHGLPKTGACTLL